MHAGARHPVRNAALAAGLLLASGCTAVGNYFAGEDNTEPPAELPRIEPTLSIETLWRTDTGAGSDKQYLKLTPAVGTQHLFTADRDGRVTAVSLRDGRRAWSVDTGVSISGGPGVGGGMAIVGSIDGEVVALDHATGEKRWQAQVSSEVLAAPRIADGVVVIRTIDGKLFGLDAGSGRQIWVYDRTVPVLTLRGTSSPVITDDGMVVAGFDSGKLVAIDLKAGKPIWETRVAVPSGRSDLERMVDIDAEPVIVERTVYVVTFQGRVAALSLDNGRVRWARDMSSHAGISVDGRNVYLTDENSHVWALDRFTGASIWKQDAFHARHLTAPASIRSMVVVGDFEGYLHWLRKEDGSILARTQADGSAIIAPGIVHDGTLYTYSADGTVGAFR